MKNAIQNAVGVLVGMPLWSLGRAADLAWFEFGSRRSVQGWKGKGKEVGDYALHIQCPWRIRIGNSIVVGRGDIFCTPEETSKPTPTDFDWQKGNRFDRVVLELFENESRQFTVQAGEAGSLSIGLEGGYKLEIFPHDSESDEHWRFFKPHAEEPHFVVSGETLRHE
jgi:hypothetical protein